MKESDSWLRRVEQKKDQTKGGEKDELLCSAVGGDRRIIRECEETNKRWMIW